MSVISIDKDSKKIEIAWSLVLKGDIKQAEDIYRQLVSAKTSNHLAYGNLAALVGMKGNRTEMIELLKRAIEIEPNYAEAHSNLGITYFEKGDLNAAISSYQKALRLKPKFPDALNNLGMALQEKGDFSLASSLYEKALKIRPSYQEARWNLSHVQLMTLDYISGWQNYESRWRKNDTPRLDAQPQIPKWTGQVKNKDEKLLVVSEQGLGDTIQFMRYIPYIRSKGIEVSFCAQEKLHDLIRISGIDPNPLTKDQANEIKEGQWIPLLSLPGYLGVTPKNPIVTKPYVRSSNDLILKWKSILSKEKRPIIGINWQGNQKVEKVHHKGRSLALEQFSCIGNNTKMNFLSLQKGFGSEQLDKCSFRNNFVNCQHEINKIWNFNEISAIIANCDLIITCDTSIAHLAGGMGRNVWLLLRDVPFWTWGINSSRTFWYPSMKLFRQKIRDDWDELLARVQYEIKKEFGT